MKAKKQRAQPLLFFYKAEQNRSDRRQSGKFICSSGRATERR
ncbi:hypothetical protein HMPREF0868_0454 [Mageeibacillus indolicus UPII9-5]|uniref:Uncharacterized protein n=1 Tax=Mageeibacillus indolicus (strain UPII9-5) TaxID=699246 RepID=D3R0S9_MAGIU|nr:hypothetical protein HMPREF0868_0454 [Mageeibacillus indolicus UPII9-5]